jgi:hypothetical protein
LVLAGFERNAASDNQTGTGWPWNIFGGGSLDYGEQREMRVLLISAEVMPKDPLRILAPGRRQ